MKRADLQKAHAIAEHIQLLEQATDRCQAGVFKTAFIVVQGNAHGQSGTDGRQQQAESRVALDRETMLDLLGKMKGYAHEELRQLGVEP